MLTQKELKTMFEYREGNLYWRASRPGVKAGTRAGNIGPRGYGKITLARKTYLSHRLVFLYHKGSLPKQVDHIDGNPSNNRIENLRAATQSENLANMKDSGKNTSGFKGVHRDKKRGLWQAAGRVNGKKKFLGRFENPVDAAKAYDESAKRAYGEYAHLNFNEV